MAFPQVADSKKVQTFINRLGRSVQQARAIVEGHRALRAAWAADPPDVAGTPLEGISIPAVVAWPDQLEAWTETAIASGLVAGTRPHHVEEL